MARKREREKKRERERERERHERPERHEWHERYERARLMEEQLDVDRLAHGHVQK